MPIKYAEITIIKNLKEETILNYFNRLLLENENKTNDNDTIIILFDDDPIFTEKNEYINKKFKIGPKSVNSYPPLYFEIKNSETFFYKSPIEENGIKKLNFKNIFNNNNKFSTLQSSIYNSIYYSLNNNDALALVKIKSSEEKPRFLLAYDNKYFEKNDVIYLVNYIFSQSN